MITRIKVKNFKSLADFEIAGLSDFVCFIGLNGSGKTTVLQFLDFVRALLLGRINEWFEQNKMEISDILTFGMSKRNIEFEIDVADNSQTQTWSAKFNILERRCTSEILKNESGEIIASFAENDLKINGKNFELPPNFKQEGSIFSFLKPMHTAPDFLVSSKTFSILNPSDIAKAAPAKTDKKMEVKADGSGLVGFISQLAEDKQKELFEELQKFYPSIKNHKIRKRYGWKTLMLNEIENIYFKASYLSYGTLRLLLMLSQKYSSNKCLVFDEIENGINQELVEKLLDTLQNFNEKQVIITTHSALVLNYLTDEAAKKSVVFLYKDSAGYSHAVKFFEIPKIAEQMEFMAPGQIMSQTNLIELSKELAKQELEK